MDFQSFKNETLQTQERAEALERAGERQWLCNFVNGQPKNCIRVAVYFRDISHYRFMTDEERERMQKERLCVRMTLQRWIPHPSVEELRDGGDCVRIGGMELRGGWFDQVEAEEATQWELRALLSAREVVDAWIYGELQLLPDRLI